jgi:hypothetical protein
VKVNQELNASTRVILPLAAACRNVQRDDKIRLFQISSSAETLVSFQVIPLPNLPSRSLPIYRLGTHGPLAMPRVIPSGPVLGLQHVSGANPRPARLIRLRSLSSNRPSYTRTATPCARLGVSRGQAAHTHVLMRWIALPDPQTRRETLNWLRSDIDRLRLVSDIVRAINYLQTR